MKDLHEDFLSEVYRAHHPLLKRDVAIKVSAAKFSERFEREAQVIAALNHPNIRQLYEVGPNYLVMGYVEGEPHQRITGGAFKVTAHSATEWTAHQRRHGISF